MQRADEFTLGAFSTQGFPPERLFSYCGTSHRLYTGPKRITLPWRRGFTHCHPPKLKYKHTVSREVHSGTDQKAPRKDTMLTKK